MKYKGQNIEIKSIGYNENKVKRQVEEIRKIFISLCYGYLIGLAIVLIYYGLGYIFP